MSDPSMPTNHPSPSLSPLPPPAMEEQEQQNPISPNRAASTSFEPEPNPSTPPSPSFSLFGLSPFDTTTTSSSYHYPHGAHVSSFVNDAPWGICGEGVEGMRNEGGCGRERRVNLVIGDAEKVFPLVAETETRTREDAVEAPYSREIGEELVDYTLDGYSMTEPVCLDVCTSADEVHESYTLYRDMMRSSPLAGRGEKKRKYATPRMHKNTKKMRMWAKKGGGTASIGVGEDELHTKGMDELVRAAKDRKERGIGGKMKEEEEGEGNGGARSVSSHCSSGYSSSRRLESFSVSDEEGVGE